MDKDSTIANLLIVDPIADPIILDPTHKISPIPDVIVEYRATNKTIMQNLVSDNFIGLNS